MSENITELIEVRIKVKKHQSEEENETIFLVESIFKPEVLHQIITGQSTWFLKNISGVGLIKDSEWKEGRMVNKHEY